MNMKLITKISLLLMAPLISVAVIILLFSFLNALYELLLESSSLALSGEYEKLAIYLLLLMFGVGLAMLFTNEALSCESDKK